MSVGGRWIGAAAIALAALSVRSGADPGRREPIGIWIAPERIAELPTSGPAWENLCKAAVRPLAPPNLSDQDDPTNVLVLARALCFARTGESRLRDEVVRACRDAIGTEAGGTALSLGRELAAYVIAADLVGLPDEVDGEFRAWLRRALDRRMDGRSLRSTHEERPNNWGTHAGASRLAAAVYLGDREEVTRAAAVFRGWLGDRSAYRGFTFKDLDWQADPDRPVGINPRGAVRDGHPIDGVLPDDQRRGGPFVWPPPRENYVYEALQGALAQAMILSRAGYPDVWEWQDRALLRAFTWLHEQAGYPADGDDTWQPHVVNRAYGAAFPAPVPARPGKNLGWTDWTHGTGE